MDILGAETRHLSSFNVTVCKSTEKNYIAASFGKKIKALVQAVDIYLIETIRKYALLFVSFNNYLKSVFLT